jgi:hypothetical protein
MAAALPPLIARALFYNAYRTSSSFFVFIFTTWEGVEGGKTIQKKKVPWVLWKGALAIGAAKASAMVLWPVHLIGITQTMFAGDDALSKSTHT